MGLFLIAALGVLGLGVESRLQPTSLSVPDTPSAKGSALLRAHFGDSAPFAILLRGPAGALDRQGPALVRALRDDPKVTTLSSWDGAPLARLRPTPNKALIFADFHTSTQDAVGNVVPALNETLAEEVHAPVRATQTGYASLSRAIQEGSIDSTERAELIAIPFLLIVLLLVFRSPIAAAIPLCFGAAAVIASRGVLFLATGWIGIDAFSLTVATMMGLALGVDYALLMVSRFREELAAGKDPAQAAWSTRRTAGRTTMFAGTTLFVSMIVSIFVLPGSLLLSLAGTAILVTAISVAISNLLAPPLLCLLGENINRWRLGSNGEGDHTLLNRSLGAALRRPAPIALAISAGLLLLAAPALAIKTGPPSVTQLPTSDPARVDAETIAREMGPGWDAPFVLVAAAEQGPIASRERLRRLSGFQELLASQPGVVAVIGPGQVARRTAPLARRGRGLLGAEGARRVEQLSAVGPRLTEAGSGVGQLRDGLSQAVAGAGLLDEGSGAAQEGAERIAAGLGRAAAGGERAGDAIERLADGAARLSQGQHDARSGSLSIYLSARDMVPQLRRGPLALARELRVELGQLSASDPALASAAERADRLVIQLGGTRNGLRSLRSRSARLRSGLTKLAGGGDRLADGTDRLAEASGALRSGLERLYEGAGSLAGGLTRLQGGTQALAAGLSEGYTRSAPLEGGLANAGERASSGAEKVAAQRDSLRRSSPHLFDSGYFVLSALDGANPAERDRAAQAIDLDHGGQAAAILLIPRYSLNTSGSEALAGHLNTLASNFAKRSGLLVGVTGGPAQLTDYNRVMRDRVPLVILAMTVVTFLALVAIFRALILAALAVVLNLATVGVAFGVLTLLFEVPPGWPLGGHTYVDAIGAAAIFGIVFGLSVDYAVFLLARMRESYDRTGDHREAISFGLRRTARVITGAAAIMMAVFIAFAGAEVATVSQLGVGLAVAVFLDATVVRIVLLPALMLLIGERVWWLPAPLARVLPRIALHPA